MHLHSTDFTATFFPLHARFLCGSAIRGRRLFLCRRLDKVRTSDTVTTARCCQHTRSLPVLLTANRRNESFNTNSPSYSHTCACATCRLLEGGAYFAQYFHCAATMGRTKFSTSGAHDVIEITSPQKNDLCTEELGDRAQVITES